MHRNLGYHYTSTGCTPLGIIATSQVGKRYVIDVGHKKGHKMMNTLLQGQDEPQRGLLEEDR